MSDEVQVSAPDVSQPALPNPISTDPVEQNTDAKPVKEIAKEEKKTPSIEDSLRKARDKVEAREKQDAKEEKPVKTAPKETKQPDDKATQKEEPPKKPAATDASEDEPVKTVDSEKKKPTYEAPNRFSAEAKAEWDKAPDHIKAETHRAFRELEQGLSKYKETAAEYEELKDYTELAKKHGTSVKAALDNYTAIEKLFASDPIAAIERVLSNGQSGITLRDIAAHVLEQPADQRSSQTDRTIQQLQSKIQELEKSTMTVQERFKEQETAEQARVVEEWAKDKPLFKQLSREVEELVQKEGLHPDDAYVKAVEDAKTKFSSLFPDRALSPSPAQTEELAAPQTRKGSLSIKGAPSSGSDPATPKPSSSTREAISRARARAG